MSIVLGDTAPAREERLKAGIAYGGTCSHLVELQEALAKPMDVNMV